MTIAFALQLRWVLWALGLGFVCKKLYLSFSKNQNRTRVSHTRVSHTRDSNDTLPFAPTLFALCGIHFFLGLLAKWSQLETLQLNAQDFWLFVDMLRQMEKGGPFLTRFAPQLLGWVQHGMIHPFFTYYLILPFSWLFGPTTATLMLNPLMISLGGMMLAILCRPRWGPKNALVLCFLFLCTTQVGKLLMYEAHPESAYPFFVFLWTWAAGYSDGKIRWPFLALATVGGMAVKEDSFLVFLPLIACTAWTVWTSVSLKKDRIKAVGLTSLLAVLVIGIQILSIRNWSMGFWGPAVWAGQKVQIPTSAGPFKGLHWNSVESISKILILHIQDKGGFLGFLKSLIAFFISRPWLSLVVIAPWILVQKRLWFLIAPLAATHALLGGLAGKLMLYYSASFLGPIWIAATHGQLPLSKITQEKRLTWMTFAALCLGGGGMIFYFPSEQSRLVKKEIRLLSQCLRSSSENFVTQGLVPSPFLGIVPEKHVWTDRLPTQKKDWNQINFALFSRNLPSFSFSTENADSLHKKLSTDQNWIRLGRDCKPAAKGTEAGTETEVEFFLRR